MKTKRPGWRRIIKYCFNCLWHHLIYPVVQDKDSFAKNIDENRNNQLCEF